MRVRRDVLDGVLGVAVSEIIQNEPRIRALGRPWRSRRRGAACAAGQGQGSGGAVFSQGVPAGGLALDGSRWIDSSRRFFLPVHALSRVFRDKFIAGLKQFFTQGKLQFRGSQQRLAASGCFPSFLR